MLTVEVGTDASVSVIRPTNECRAIGHTCSFVDCSRALDMAFVNTSLAFAVDVNAVLPESDTFWQMPYVN